jgi:hypothetical protein
MLKIIQFVFFEIWRIFSHKPKNMPHKYRYSYLSHVKKLGIAFEETALKKMKVPTSVGAL